jgi:GTPase SAR1 family protein
MGAARVGKTTLIDGYLSRPLKDQYQKTAGADFFVERINHDYVQLWDIAADFKEQHEQMDFALRHASVIIWVINLTDKKSIEHYEEYVKNNLQHLDAIKILVATHVDNQKKEITETDLKNINEKYKFILDKKYVVNAKDSNNTRNLFNDVIQKIIEVPQEIKQEVEGKVSQKNDYSLSSLFQKIKEITQAVSESVPSLVKEGVAKLKNLKH